MNAQEAVVALTDDDIKALFELRGSAVVWREIRVEGLNAVLRRAAAKHNAKAGSVVEFWAGFQGQPMVTAGGEQVTRKRIESVLTGIGGSAKSKAKAQRARSGVKAKVPATSAAAKMETPEQRAERMRLEALEADRVRHIRAAMGFVGTPRGEWLRPDGKKWHKGMLLFDEAKKISAEWMAQRESGDE